MASETLAKIDRAYDVVSALCEGKREWFMSIPARPDHDPDLIIGDALLAARNEIARLTRELEAARAENRRLREALERVVDGGCERFAGTDCWQMGMDPNAKDYADRVCDSCFARRALATDTEVSDGE